MLFKFEDVNKSFGVQRVFRNLNFSLERETFSILTGSSGSGKSTLFKMLCGIESPSSGKIVFLGNELRELTPGHLKHIGIIFQNPRGLPEWTLFDNIALPLVVDRMPPKIIQKKVLHWLDTMGLRSRAQSLYRELSGGEMQKAEFARALIRKPRLILADEPTAHLDSVQADLILDILWEHYQEGATVFISTHHPPQFEHPLILRYDISDFSIKSVSKPKPSPAIHMPGETVAVLEEKEGE